MGKRKTRKEKVRSDLRKQIVRPSSDFSENYASYNQAVYTTPTQFPAAFALSPSLTINDYHTVRFEIKKTTIIVFLLMIFQLFLFTLLTLHILTIPYLNY